MTECKLMEEYVGTKKKNVELWREKEMECCTGVNDCVNFACGSAFQKLWIHCALLFSFSWRGLISNLANDHLRSVKLNCVKVMLRVVARCSILTSIDRDGALPTWVEGHVFRNI